MTFQVVSGTLAADVAASSGTFTVSYPAGCETGTFYKAQGHKFVLGQNSALSFPASFDITLGASSITVTNKTASIWPAGTVYKLQLEEQGKRAYRDDFSGNLLKKTYQAPQFIINLGAPDTAVAAGYCASQDLTALGVFSSSVTAAAAIAAATLAGTADVPRNVVAAWTGAAIITITGTDVYGNVVVEKSASGTSLAGKKAFKTVTGISSNANITALTVGSGDVLGLPVFLPEIGFVLKELESGSAPTAGTVVAGVATAGGETATAGDIRGTYDPNSACNGALVFQLIVALPDPGNTGQAQYAG